jgi:hypothetical protein
MAAADPDGYEAFAEVPWVWSDQYDVNLQVAGRPLPTDEVVFRGDPEAAEFSAMLLRDGVLIAAVGINCADDVRAARAVIGMGLCPNPRELADIGNDLRKLLDSERKASHI